MILLLLRHARAEPAVDGDDIERALTVRGRDDARRLGSYLRENGFRPQRALVSAARRTRETFEVLAAELGDAAPVADHRDALFNADGAALLAAVHGAGPCECLLLVGHNPGVAELAVGLAGSGDEKQRQQLAARFPPCSLAVLDFDGEGSDAVQAGAGRLRALVLPDDLISR